MSLLETEDKRGNIEIRVQGWVYMCQEYFLALNLKPNWGPRKRKVNIIGP
jgi:hypothetical protein